MFVLNARMFRTLCAMLGLTRGSFPRSMQSLFEYVDFEPLHNPSPAIVVVFVYFGVFALYWLWSLLSLFPTVHTAWTMRTFYTLKLRINTRELQTMEWYAAIPCIYLYASCCRAGNVVMVACARCTAGKTSSPAWTSTLSEKAAATEHSSISIHPYRVHKLAMTRQHRCPWCGSHSRCPLTWWPCASCAATITSSPC